MKESIKDYARIGLVHHMLYHECMEKPDDHVKTLEEFVEREDIETFDCCIPYGEERRKRLISTIKNSGKEIVYAAHLFPLRKISLASTSPQEQGLIRLIFSDQIAIAKAIQATGFITGSGADVPEYKRQEARLAFSDFCRWFCRELKPAGITALLEPFDRTIDKKFLYGPTVECIELIQSLEPEVDNLGIELDIAHLPLMGETFEHAIKTTAPYLKRVHLGNCVLKDTSSTWYGDQHPPIGIEGGEIDIRELSKVLRLLLETEYLSKENRGSLLLEMKPFPDRTVEDTIADSMERLSRAWEMIFEEQE